MDMMNSSEIESLLQYKNNFLLYSHVKSIEIKKSNVYDPVVSIVIPTYKRSQLLEEAIDSALDQAGDFNYEIVVVDNNPDRDCLTEQLILNKYAAAQNISYYKNEKNLGLFGNWNRCYELAQAEWVAMLHDDDLLKSDYLQTTQSHFQSKDIVMIGVDPVFLYQVEIKKKFKLLKNYARKFIRFCGKFFYKEEFFLSACDFIGCAVHPCGFLLRKSALLKLGGFRIEKNIWISDYVFQVYLYMSNTGKILIINKNISVYRIKENISLRLSMREQYRLQHEIFSRCIRGLKEKQKIKKWFCLKYLRAMKFKDSRSSGIFRRIIGNFNFMFYAFVVYMIFPYHLRMCVDEISEDANAM